MSDGEASVVLSQVHRLLVPHPEVVKVEEPQQDRLRATINGVPAVVTCEINHEPEAHPSIAHVHVQVRTEHATLAGPFDACLIGVNADRNSGLREAALLWFHCAAGPIFSLFHARPVFEAVHFDGTQAWGVPGAHGFAGPVTVRCLREPFNAAVLAERPLFSHALEVAPPAVAHLVKVLVMSREDDPRLWKRTLEIDGHLATYTDAAWNAGVEGKPGVIATRFATFHVADQPIALTARRQLDEVILAYVETFTELRDMEATQQRLLERGMPERVVDRVHHFLTLALGWSLYISELPLTSPNTYQRVLPSGESLPETPLMSEPAYARGVAMAGELSRGKFAEGVKELALSSAAVAVVNQMLDAGSRLEDLTLAPFLVPDPGTSSEAYDVALNRFQAELRARATPARARPWWKFWG